MSYIQAFDSITLTIIIQNKFKNKIVSLNLKNGI
jgi:hypothetical protein